MTCVKVFDDGKVHCEGKYTTNNSFNKRSASYSILMHLEHEYCNAMCDYCCCHPMEQGANFDLYKDGFKADYPAMIAKIKECPIYNDYNASGEIHFDIWGGEPLFNFQALKEVVEVLRKEWPGCSLTVSSNGLLLGVYADWIVENKIYIQLSHDGWGQWIRTKEVDPLDNEVICKGLKKINDAGLFSAINATLSYYNYSFTKNIEYFITHLKKWNLDKCGYIKLNHIYNSDYDIDRINVKGHWQDGYREDLKGTKIGNVAIRDKIADEYFTEFFNLALVFRDKTFPKDPYFELFRSYIMEQSQRWREVDETKQSSGACRAFQSWKYNIEGNYKQDWTFVINTLGEYCECNLCEKVDNPGSPLPDYCKDCKYKNQSECHGCGSMHRPKECNFLYKWCQTLEKLHQVDTLLKNTEKSCSCSKEK